MEDFSTIAIALGAVAAASSVASTVVALTREWLNRRLNRRRPSVTMKLPDGRTIDLTQSLSPEKVEEIIAEVSEGVRASGGGNQKKS